MQVLGRSVATVLLAGGALLGAAPAANADEFYFLAETTAVAAHLVVTQQPASSIVTASALDDTVGYAAASFDSGGASAALAAPVFPGRLVAEGPTLLCTQLFDCPQQPPPYPLLAEASYPRHQHDRADASGQKMGGGPFTVTPLEATATASARANSSRSVAGGSTLLAGTPGEVTIGASAATSSVRLDGGQLAVRVTSAVSDITIAGLVHIDSITSVDTVSLPATARPTDRPHITVAGVTVAGQAATIDERGIHVAGQDGPSLQQQLSQSGIEIQTVRAAREDSPHAARSDTAGVLVRAAFPVSGVPYVPNPLPALPPPFDQIPRLPGVNANGTYLATVTLGGVGVAAGVSRSPAFHLPGGGVTTTPGSPSTPPATGGTGAPVAAGGPAGGALPPAVQPPATTGRPRVAGGGVDTVRAFIALLARDRLDTLYAVLALGSAGLFLTWRLAAFAARRREGAG